jgi:hypothetical protein
MLCMVSGGWVGDALGKLMRTVFLREER